MFNGLLDRAQFLRVLTTTFIAKLLPFWAALGAWDLFMSQVIPRGYSEKFPKLYEVVEMTTGFMPWYVWAVSGSAIIALAAIEAAYRISKDNDHLRDIAADSGQREYFSKALAEDRMAISNSAARLRASITQVRNRQGGAEEEWHKAREELRHLAERIFSFDETLARNCFEAVHLSDMIVDSVRNHEDYREDYKKFDELSKIIPRQALLLSSEISIG